MTLTNSHWRQEMGHFNIDLFKEHPNFFTDEKRDKIRQDMIMEKLICFNKPLFCRNSVVSPEKCPIILWGQCLL